MSEDSGVSTSGVAVKKFSRNSDWEQFSLSLGALLAAKNADKALILDGDEIPKPNEDLITVPENEKEEDKAKRLEKKRNRVVNNVAWLFLTQHIDATTMDGKSAYLTVQSHAFKKHHGQGNFPNAWKELCDN